MIVHTTNEQGVWQASYDVDPFGPQIAGAIYTPTPEHVEGQTPVWDGTAWVMTANEDLPLPPEPVVPLPVIPTSVSRAQGKVALINAGLWPSVLVFVAGIEDATQKAVAEVALNDASTWERSSKTLNAMSYGLGMNDAQLDALFVAAAGVVL